MNVAPQDLQKIRAWAQTHEVIQRVWLYGSRARGDNQPDSDIDLAIVTRLDTGQDNADAVWMFWHQDFKETPDLHLSHEVHLEWYEDGAGSERVGRGVERDGILIYPE